MFDLHCTSLWIRNLNIGPSFWLIQSMWEDMPNHFELHTNLYSTNRLLIQSVYYMYLENWESRGNHDCSYMNIFIVHTEKIKMGKIKFFSFLQIHHDMEYRIIYILNIIQCHLGHVHVYNTKTTVCVKRRAHLILNIPTGKGGQKFP